MFCLISVLLPPLRWSIDYDCDSKRKQQLGVNEKRKPNVEFSSMMARLWCFVLFCFDFLSPWGRVCCATAIVHTPHASSPPVRPSGSTKVACCCLYYTQPVSTPNTILSPIPWSIRSSLFSHHAHPSILILVRLPLESLHLPQSSPTITYICISTRRFQSRPVLRVNPNTRAQDNPFTPFNNPQHARVPYSPPDMRGRWPLRRPPGRRGGECLPPSFAGVLRGGMGTSKYRVGKTMGPV